MIYVTISLLPQPPHPKIGWDNIGPFTIFTQLVGLYLVYNPVHLTVLAAMLEYNIAALKLLQSTCFYFCYDTKVLAAQLWLKQRILHCSAPGISSCKKH